MIRTVDSDVVALAVAVYHDITEGELWVSFGVGPSHRYLSIHQMAVAPERAKMRLFPSSMLSWDLFSIQF